MKFLTQQDFDDIIDDPEEKPEPELVLTAEEKQLILDQRQGKS
jgi:hypothetical protein